MLSMVYISAKSVILGRKNQKKVLQNPGGTDKMTAERSGLKSDHVN